MNLDSKCGIKVQSHDLCSPTSLLIATFKATIRNIICTFEQQSRSIVDFSVLIFAGLVFDNNHLNLQQTRSVFID